MNLNLIIGLSTLALIACSIGLGLKYGPQNEGPFLRVLSGLATLLALGLLTMVLFACLSFLFAQVPAKC